VALKTIYSNNKSNFMNIIVLKTLVANAEKFLPQDEFVTFRKQVNEVYLQSELRSLYLGMPVNTEPEPWRAERIFKINQQLAAL
jgi:hypothetical protein